MLSRRSKKGFAYEGVLVPVDTFRFVGVGVGKAGNLTGLAAEEAVKLWSDLVAFAFA